jgi:hypothetical protein
MLRDRTEQVPHVHMVKIDTGDSDLHKEMETTNGHE